MNDDRQHNETPLNDEQRRKYIRKIQLIFEQGRGGTAEETHAALGMARRLMAKYGITERDLEDGNAEGEFSIGSIVIDSDTDLPHWKKHLAYVVGSAYRCICHWERTRDGVYYLKLFGNEEDATIAYHAYLFSKQAGEELWNAFRTEWEAADLLATWKGRRRTLREMTTPGTDRPLEEAKDFPTYMLGFAEGVQAAIERQNESEALVLVVPALVRRTFEQTLPGIEEDTQTSDAADHDPRVLSRGVGDGIWATRNKRTVHGTDGEEELLALPDQSA